MVTVLKRAAKAALAANIGIAENSCLSCVMLSVDLKENFGGSSSAKATLSRCSAKLEDENRFKTALPHCVSVERCVRK